MFFSRAFILNRKAAIVIGIIAILNCYVFAQASIGKTKIVEIPVYYLTDRDRVGKSFGASRKYLVNCKHDMFYGKAFISVKNVRTDLSQQFESKLGWKFTNEHVGKVSPKECFDEDNPAFAKEKFFDTLSQAIEESGSRNLCIFVHGANDGFEDAATDAAELAYCLEYPVVLYSWPSVPKMFGYIIDNGNNEWSQAHFEMFLKDLQTFKEKYPVQITLVSHSMGNRLVIRSGHKLSGTGLINDFELVSPDIDLGICQHYLLGLQNHGAKVRLYFSRKDKMLALAQYLFGGYFRLGEGIGGNLSPINEESQANRNNFERIDFTTIDKGFRGHSIPFGLIANMVHTDKPGYGLAFIDTSAEKSSRLVKRVSSKQLKQTNSTLIGPCKRVIKVTYMEP